jgi:type III pantothenate kinase
MLLAMDIGNTNTVVGVFDNHKLLNQFRVASNHRMTVDECGFFVIGILEKLKIEKRHIDRVTIASVVPRLTAKFERMSHRYFEMDPLMVTSDIKLPIKIAYDDPSAVGADRIANAVAAYERYHAAVIAVDFGTTTNFDVIDSRGNYYGGAIAPGPEMSVRQLAQKAARLFEVTIERPPSVIGRNTTDSIRSGIYYGTIGTIDTIIKLILDELGEDARVIATGGIAASFADGSRYITDLIPELTLDGLRLITDFQDE